MELAGRYLPNQYQRQVVAYPHEVAPGKYVDQYVVNQVMSLDTSKVII